jgi:type II secretory pathway pseudopilin PulG
MKRYYHSRRFLVPLGVALLAALPLVLSSPAVRAGQDTTQGQQQQNQQDQSQTQQPEKPKKKGGFFGGLKSITGSSSEQTSATASAGAKGVGEGAKMANLTPTPADIAAVTSMEQYSIPPQDLKKFDQDGHLQPKQ